MNSLETQDLTKKYQARSVVQGISLSMKSGENCGFIRAQWGRKNILFLHDVGINSSGCRQNISKPS